MTIIQKDKTLAEVPSGGRSIVKRLQGGSSFVSSFVAMGFTVGHLVKVVHNSGKGPLITQVGNTRIALGRGEALKVVVKEVTGDKHFSK